MHKVSARNVCETLRCVYFSEFLVSYHAVDGEKSVVELSMLNDWDLDAAFLSSSRPVLQLTVQLKEVSSCKETSYLLPYNFLSCLNITRQSLLHIRPTYFNWMD